LLPYDREHYLGFGAVGIDYELAAEPFVGCRSELLQQAELSLTNGAHCVGASHDLDATDAAVHGATGNGQGGRGQLVEHVQQPFAGRHIEPNGVSQITDLVTRFESARRTEQQNVGHYAPRSTARSA
jgi:hypothetical protein